jgi:hypothetical protein
MAQLPIYVQSANPGKAWCVDYIKNPGRPGYVFACEGEVSVRSDSGAIVFVMRDAINGPYEREKLPGRFSQKRLNEAAKGLIRRLADKDQVTKPVMILRR